MCGRDGVHLGVEWVHGVKSKTGSGIIITRPVFYGMLPNGNCFNFECVHHFDGYLVKLHIHC